MNVLQFLKATRNASCDGTSAMARTTRNAGMAAQNIAVRTCILRSKKFV